MITVQEYLQLVSKTSIEYGVQDEDCIEWLSYTLPNEDKMERLRKSMESFCLDPEEGRDGLILIVPLSDFKSQILDNEYFNLENWLYDRVTGYVLVNMEFGSHESVAALLAQAYTSELKRGRIRSKDQGKYAEEFIERGYGWKCSAGTYGRILKSKDIKLTAQEKIVFKQFVFMDL